MGKLVIKKKKSTKKRKTRTASPMQRKALKVITEKLKNGKKINLGQIMRDAGFTEATSKNPTNLTHSQAYIDIMNQNGLGDAKLAETHAQLKDASKINTHLFNAAFEEVVVKGKGKKPDTTKTIWHHLSDEVIKEIIESVPGHVVLFIQATKREKTVYYKAPEHGVRKGAIEMAYKAKGHFAPEVHRIIDDTMGDEDQKKYDEIFKQNKKTK